MEYDLLVQEKDEVEKALQLKCNKKLIQNHIATTTGKMKCN